MALTLIDQATFMLVNQPVSGTFVAPNPATNALSITDGGYERTGEKDESKPAVAWFTPAEFSIFNEQLSITGKSKLVGHPTLGTIPPIDLAMRLAGHAVVTSATQVTYTPTPTGSNFICSARYVTADEANDAADVKARVEEILVDIDKESTISFAFQGGLIGESDLATPAGTYAADRKASRATTANTVLTINGISVAGRKLSIKPNATLVTLPDFKVKETGMTARVCAFEITLKKEDLALINVAQLARLGSKVPILLSVKDSTDLPGGLRLEIPSAQFDAVPALSSNAGTAERKFTGTCYAATPGGEYVIKLGDVTAVV